MKKSIILSFIAVGFGILVIVLHSLPVSEIQMGSRLTWFDEDISSLF